MELKLKKHQLEAIKQMKNEEYFALFMEQGTGKTAALLGDAENLFSNGKIDAMLIIAPKGVHISWVKREIPKTLSIEYKAAYYSNMPKAKRAVNELYDVRVSGTTPALKILSINYDALLTVDGWKAINRFLKLSLNTYAVLDESTRIKNPKSKRTLRCMQLRSNMKYRRIATGTPVSNAPIDVFSQMEFLEEGLLGTTSYRAFVAEYAEVLPDDGHLMRHITKRLGDQAKFKKPQIIARNEKGLPIYRNLDKLNALLKPHSYRVLKSEVLDLPPKIYKTIYFELEPGHMRLYDSLKNELRIEVEEDLLTFNKLTVITKLQQVTSGFIKLGDETSELNNKQRMDTLLDIINDIDGQIIIWAKFRKEIEMIATTLQQAGHSIVQYHGGTKAKDREHAIDAFQNGEARFFIGHQKAAGIGLTLTAANTVIYFSNDFSIEDRQQSEDRAHRIGTTKSVTYIDIVAVDTIDERIADALQNKKETAAIVLDDRNRQAHN